MAVIQVNILKAEFSYLKIRNRTKNGINFWPASDQIFRCRFFIFWL